MNKLLAFAAGAVTGSIATYFVVKKRFEKIAQEEIDSVKEVFNRRLKEENSEPEPKCSPNQVHEEKSEECTEETTVSKKLTREEFEEYRKIAAGYTVIDDDDELLDQKYDCIDDEPERPRNTDRPYVIEPSEFGALDGYDLITLYHFSDGVLADDNEEKIDNPEEIVGSDYAEHFGEYEDYCVFIRNERLKVDYEILIDDRKHSDTVWRPPHFVG